LQHVKLENVNLIKLPISAGIIFKPNPDNLLKANEMIVYRQIVGLVLYLVNCTKFNISYAISQLARFMSVLSTIYYKIVKQLLWYFKGILNIGILYSNRLDIDLITYNIYTDTI
jgi:hypothetical protein